MKRTLLALALAGCCGAPEDETIMVDFRVPPGAERRAKTKLWYEENSPGQRRLASIASLPTAGSVMPVLEVRDFGEPQAITLQLDRNRITLGAGPSNVSIRARVTYGVGGASDTFECDWNDGGLITIVAQRLTVVATAVAADPDVVYAFEGLEVELIAAVGKETPSVIMPTLTQQLPVIGPSANSGYLEPPAFAKAVSFMGFVTPTNSLDFYQQVDAQVFNLGGVSAYGIVDLDYLGGGSAMPLPNNSLLVLANNNAVESVKPTLIWHLGL